MMQANEAIELLREKVDTLIVIANDKLLQASSKLLLRISFSVDHPWEFNRWSAESGQLSMVDSFFSSFFSFFTPPLQLPSAPHVCGHFLCFEIFFFFIWLLVYNQSVVLHRNKHTFGDKKRVKNGTVVGRYLWVDSPAFFIWFVWFDLIFFFFGKIKKM